MANLWLKIKIWTKIIFFSVVMIYVGIFIFNNANKPLPPIWVWFYKDVDATALELIPSLLLGGVVGTVLVRMAYRAVKQFQELKRRKATEQLHKDVAEMKAKAAMLQTKPELPTDSNRPS
jgi:hypothetical protein